ncbi:MAG: hypothetical protein AB9842_08235 [Bacteroidales bacterium]
MLIITDEQYLEVETLSGTGYSVYKIAMYLNVSYYELQNEYEDPLSQFRYHYDRGILMKEAERDKTLSDAAKMGSASAAIALEKRMEERRLSDFKEKLLGGY